MMLRFVESCRQTNKVNGLNWLHWNLSWLTGFGAKNSGQFFAQNGRKNPANGRKNQQTDAKQEKWSFAKFTKFYFVCCCQLKMYIFIGCPRVFLRFGGSWCLRASLQARTLSIGGTGQKMRQAYLYFTSAWLHASDICSVGVMHVASLEYDIVYDI